MIRICSAMDAVITCNDRPSQVSVAPPRSPGDSAGGPPTTCNDRPSQVSVAPPLRIAAEYWEIACNDRPSQVSVAPVLHSVGRVNRPLATIAQVRFPLHPLMADIQRGGTASCNDRPSQVSVAPASQVRSTMIQVTCNDRPSQVSVAPLPALLVDP